MKRFSDLPMFLNASDVEFSESNEAGITNKFGKIY